MVIVHRNVNHKRLSTILDVCYYINGYNLWVHTIQTVDRGAPGGISRHASLGLRDTNKGNKTRLFFSTALTERMSTPVTAALRIT